MKRDKIIYWTLTGLLSLSFASASFMYLTKNPELVAGFKQLGFPEYFLTILGVAKLAGAIAIVNPWYQWLKEWAYAGYTFVYIGAVWTHIATGTPFVGPLVFLAITGASYYFYGRIKAGSFQVKTAV